MAQDPSDLPMPTQLVVFDLDETITRHDTLLPYALRFVMRHRPWRLPFLSAVLPAVVEFLRGRADEGRVKESFIKAALGGSRRGDIDAWTARFVPAPHRKRHVRRRHRTDRRAPSRRGLPRPHERQH